MQQSNELYKTRIFAPGMKDLEKCPAHIQPSVGVDIGIQRNYTVITAMDKVTNRQIFFWRFCPGSSMNWWQNYDALEWTFRYFGVPPAVDCTGSGTSLPYEMPLRGVPLLEWGQGESKMGWGSNKAPIFEHFRTLIGQKEVKFFNLDEIKRELRVLKWIPQPSGKNKIEVQKKDGNDDIPVSLALACMPLENKAIKYDAMKAIVNNGERSCFLTEELW